MSHAARRENPNKQACGTRYPPHTKRFLLLDQQRRPPIGRKELAEDFTLGVTAQIRPAMAASGKMAVERFLDHERYSYAGGG